MSLEGSHENPHKLYEQFRQQLKADEQDIFYDENDLIDIYDQAADMEDEYVKLQALLLAYRLYPKSEEMAARRGYFFWSYNMDEGVDQLLNSSLATDRLIWKILALRNRALTREELEKQLEDLLLNVTDIDDETMIQLVDLASEAGAFEWLKSHESLLRSKTSYLPTLLYELQVVAIIHGDREYAISKLEELTELEPFNADYWSILSEEQMNAGNVDGAISSADYALAIDSENIEAILARSRAIVCSDKADVDELLRLVTPMLKPDSTDPRPLKIAATVMMQTGKSAKATDLLIQFHERNPWNRDVIEYLLILRYPKISEVLNRFYESNSDNSETYWATWAGEKYSEGKFKEAAMIYGCYASYQPLSATNLDLYVSALYIAGFYNAAVAILEAELKDAQYAINPSVAYAGTLSLLRLGNLEKSREIVARIIKLQPKNSYHSAASVMRNAGFADVFRRIQAALNSKEVDLHSEEFERFLFSIDNISDLSDPDIDY